MAKKIKEIIDTKSSFADWLNNQIVRDQLKFDIKVCLIRNGYPPQYSPEVFRKVMEQVENFEENSDYSYADDDLQDTAVPRGTPIIAYEIPHSSTSMVAELKPEYDYGTSN